MTIVSQRICRVIITCLISFKRCHLFFYFLLYKELSYILTRLVLEWVAKNRAPVLKKNKRQKRQNENNQQLCRPRKTFSRAFSYANAHYLRDSIVLLRMRMEIHNCVAVSRCGYCSVPWFLCITGKMGVKCII